MKCPTCRQTLVIIEVDEIELDVCAGGHGLWFDSDELRQLFDLAGVPESLSRLEDQLEVLDRKAEKRRRCPRCHARMKHVEAPGPSEVVILDRCPHGDGLWFDEGELEAVLAVKLDEDDAALDRIRDYLGAFMAPKGSTADGAG